VADAGELRALLLRPQFQVTKRLRNHSHRIGRSLTCCQADTSVGEIICNPDRNCRGYGAP
jgi:hypothetical protein